MGDKISKTDATTKCKKHYGKIIATVKSTKGDVVIKKAKVTIEQKKKSKSKKAPASLTVRTDENGQAFFVVATGQYTASATADAKSSRQDPRIKFDPGSKPAFGVKSKTDKPIEFLLTPLPQIHLVLNYKDPEGKAHPFPKGFRVQVHVQDEDKPQKLKVLDDKGSITFGVPKDKTFQLSFDSAKVRVFSHDAPSEADKVPTLLEDQTDDQLRALAKSGKLFFSLPKKWKLQQSAWTATDIVVPENGKITTPEDGIGTAEAPAKLVLEPKLFFARFEFYDQKHWHSDHSDKRVPIPAVVLKGARKSDAAGAPVAPVAGTHDVAASWVVKGDDVAKACQCLPWIVTKKEDGTALPRLDKDTLIEFAWPKGYVHSESATVRKIVELEPTDTKLKPSKTRNVYYDLPKLWRSKFYYTRLAPDSAKCFDELSSDEIEGAFDVAKPLTFSLDDVVLTKGTSQRIRDKDTEDAAKDLSKHSRISVLYLDAEDKFKVKIHDPRDKAPFHSKSTFVKDGAAKYRNLIVDLLPTARAIMFCSRLHHLYDKRTTGADYAKKQIEGARAAKIDDEDVAVKKTFNRTADVDAGYVFDKRIFNFHYLHYAATNGTTVYDAVVTYWSAKFFFEDDNAKTPSGWDKDEFFKIDGEVTRGNGTLADKRNYIEKGMKNAMDGWNAKDYQLELKDDATDIVIKTFSLFEAKEIEDTSSPGTFISRGGSPMCTVGICKNDLGSWASRTVMRMRRTAYQGEGASWGSLANTEARLADYDGSTAPARNAFVHELGHAAAGLLDDYVYYVKKFSGLIRYDQYYPGMPYKVDKSSLMSVNQAIRMRMYWGRTSWVNDEAKAGKALHKFLDGKAFKLTYAPAGKTKLEFDLTGDKFKDIYKPAYKQLNYALGEKGRCDMFLYKLGDGEFGHLLKGGPYTGILAVNIKLAPKFKSGLSPKPAKWATGTAYAKGACVEEDEKFYGCLEGHTGGTFNTDLGAKKWIELDLDIKRYSWTENLNKTVGACWYVEDGNHYYIIKNHKTGQPTTTQWQLADVDKGDWAAATAYAVSNKVAQDGKTYVCRSGHTSGDAFAPDKWQEVGTDKGAWAAKTAYALSDVCQLGGKDYVCILAHTSQTAAADEALGNLLKTNSKHKSWGSADKRDWASALNKAIFKMLEGPDGKFKLTCSDGTNDFAKVYLRIYPQWDVPADPDPAEAGTHFTFEVRFDDGDGFNPTDTKLKVSNACNNKTIIRYLLGKISDQADTRSGQELTADLAKGDLGKLKDWIAGKAGGTFTVGDIT